MTVISLSDVSKRFRRAQSGQAPTLSGEILRHDRRREEPLVLDHVSLAVRRGEAFGVMGANGSGKSTMLRLIAGLSKPTSGQIVVSGQVSALMTLGETFDGLMSGEENAYTASIVAGFAPKEAKKRLAAVAEFAELEDVFDQPLRTYSTGMKMRLAFSAAINTEPEIMLIDEVLQVGDSRFQAKCADRIDDLRSSGTTMMIVAHDVRSLRRLCHRAIWLDKGVVNAIGPADEVADRYLLAMTPTPTAPSELPDGGYRVGDADVVEIDSLALFGPDGRRTETLLSGSPVSLRMRVRVKRTLPELVVGFSIHRVNDGAQALDLSSDKDRFVIADIVGPHEFRLDLDRLDLSGGHYFVNGGVFTRNFEHCFDYRWGSVNVMIAGDSTASPLAPPRRWEVIHPSDRNSTASAQNKG